MVVSRHHNVGQHHNLLAANKSFENVPNACYHSVQNLVSSRILSKNLKIKIYKTIISFWGTGVAFCTFMKNWWRNNWAEFHDLRGACHRRDECSDWSD